MRQKSCDSVLMLVLLRQLRIIKEAADALVGRHASESNALAFMVVMPRSDPASAFSVGTNLTAPLTTSCNLVDIGLQYQTALNYLRKNMVHLNM
jgi:hypothetical protein